MNLQKLLFTKNKCYITGDKITPKGIMCHSTGANNTTLKRYVNPDDGLLGVNSYGNHWNTYQPGGSSVCVHAFIGTLKDGSIATYQTLPWEYRGWHAGGSANNNYISFEICEDNLSNKDYFDKVYKEACELTAYLCKEYGLNPQGSNVIICHADGYRLGIASNHSDVLHWFNKFGKTMQNVRDDVEKLMGAVPTPSPEPESTPSEQLYKVQVGAYEKKSGAESIAAMLEKQGYETYIVFVNGLYKVQTGAFKDSEKADNLMLELRDKGFDCFITTEDGEAVPTEPKKSVHELAKEVIAGKWGNGAERKQNLTEAGYDYVEVQAEVNKILG